MFKRFPTALSVALPTFVLSAIVLPLAAWAQQDERYYHPHMWEGGGHGWFLGPIMMGIFLVILVAAVVVLVRWLAASPAHHAPAGKTPLDILKERFARGEIDKAEFEERRRVLGD